MKSIIKILVVIFLVLSSSCSKFVCNTFPSDNRSPDCSNCRILFIGSSYLSYAGNDVVTIFDEFCKVANKKVKIGTSIAGGYRLHDHIKYQPTIDKINSQGWDYVILQGNSAYISKEELHQYLVPYLSDFRQLIKDHYSKSTMIYMMPWAYLDGLTFIEGETDDYHQMQENIYQNSISIAHDIDFAVAPAGWAWYQARLAKYPATLYLNDLNHQTISGAYLTASVFYSTIFLEKAPKIEYELTPNDDEVRLREIAYEIVMSDLDLWNIY